MSIRRSAAVILTAGAIAASVLAATPAQASARVDWDDPLTTKVEKAPKTKISKGEYKRLHKGQSYAKVTRTVHGKGQYPDYSRTLITWPAPGATAPVVR